MLFHYLATNVQNQGIRYVSSTNYHKNRECPSLSDTDVIIRITNQQTDGFEPCGLCYDG